MNRQRPRVGTAALVVSTAVITAALTAGGPAIASTVVDFAKNAGAVDGKQAVQANATVNQREGKLVATGKNNGLLPNNIIARAPNSAELGGVPITGLAPALLHATGFPAITGITTTVCRTPVLTTTTASVANVEADLGIFAGLSSTAGVEMTMAYSVDGGTTWHNADGTWLNIVSATSDDPYGAVSHVATVAVGAHARLVFAIKVFTSYMDDPAAAECSVAASVLHRTPGTVDLTAISPPLTPSAGRSPFIRQAR